MGRPLKDKSLTPQDVVRAAIACLDKEGESALGVNRVARELGIKPPAIYKHLDGNAGLQRAVALDIWRNYLQECERIADNDPRSFALATRNFARRYPARYNVMMHYQMRPTDTEEQEIIEKALDLLKRSLQLDKVSEAAAIDIMRMVNAAIYGFIAREQLELMTLNRSSDRSYEVMVDALLVAIEYIRQKASSGEMRS